MKDKNFYHAYCPTCFSQDEGKFIGQYDKGGNPRIVTRYNIQLPARCCKCGEDFGDPPHTNGRNHQVPVIRTGYGSMMQCGDESAPGIH